MLNQGKETWKILSEIQNKGYSYFFNDWLDLILNSLLSMTENLQEIGISMDIRKASQGKYNDRYMAIVHKYVDKGVDKKIGERTIDLFSKAWGMLCKETLETKKDVLGEIFQQQITYGEHGQFFTPEHITEFMAKMVGKSPEVTKSDSKSPETIIDPCCGSGRFLLSSAKENPDNYFIGQDIDERCCKMAVINMFMRDLRGEIRLGDSLTNKIDKRWILNKGGFIWEEIEPKIESNKKMIEKQQTLK